MLKVNGKMWLSVATWRDACFHIVQDNKYTAFLETLPKLEGKGSPYLKEGKHNRIEKELISSCKEKLEDEIYLKCELDSKGSHNDFFVPKTFSDSNPQQKKLRRVKGKREKRKQVMRNQVKMKFKLTWV